MINENQGYLTNQIIEDTLCSECKDVQDVTCNETYNYCSACNNEGYNGLDYNKQNDDSFCDCDECEKYRLQNVDNYN